jgi:hypothetical protein
VDTRVNWCLMTGLAHEMVVLGNGDWSFVHPEGVQLDLMGVKFSRPIVATDLGVKPTLVPAVTAPECEDGLAVRAHDTDACRNEDQCGPVHRVHGTQAVCLLGE